MTWMGNGFGRIVFDLNGFIGAIQGNADLADDCGFARIFFGSTKILINLLLLYFFCLNQDSQYFRIS